MDFRPPTPRIVWDLELVNPAGGEVQLRVDGLSQVPRSVALWLTDPETQQQWSLRSTPSINMLTRPNQPKRLQVIALQTDQRPFRVQGLRVVRLRGRGAYIEFAVSQPSQVTVQVRTLTGRVVWEKKLPVTTESHRRIFWDGQSVTASPLPSFLPYLIVVQATNEDGERAQAHFLLR